MSRSNCSNLAINLAGWCGMAMFPMFPAFCMMEWMERAGSALDSTIMLQFLTLSQLRGDLNCHLERCRRCLNRKEESWAVASQRFQCMLRYVHHLDPLLSLDNDNLPCIGKLL